MNTEEKKWAGRSLASDNNVTSVRKMRKGIVMKVRQRAGINRELLQAKVPQRLKKNEWRAGDVCQHAEGPEFSFSASQKPDYTYNPST